MTGAEMKDIRHRLSEALGRQLVPSDMAKLCGLKDYARHPNGRHGNGENNYRKWEKGDGPPGPVAVLLSLYRDGINSKWEIGGFMRDAILKRLEGEA